MNPSKRLIYHPTQAPFRRLRTARHGVALGDGELKSCANKRWADCELRNRYPISALQASPPVANGEFRGALDGAFDSKRISAWYDPATGKTEIWSLNSSGTYADITPDSGKHGDCRFGSSSVLNFFSFAVVRDPYSEQDCLIIADGQDGVAPRLYAKPSSGGTLIMSVVEAITPPADAQRQKIVFTWPTYHVAGGSGTMPTYSNSDGTNWAAATSSGSAPDINVQLTRTASSAVADKTAELQYAVTKDASGCPTINFLVDRGSYQLWLEYLKIEVRDSGTTYSTIYNKPDGAYGVTVVPCDGVSTKEIWSFSLDHIASADRDAIDRIRFTWATTELPTASVTLNIYAIGFSTGECPGGALFYGSYYNTDSRAESPRFAYKIYDSARPEDIGGRPLDGLRIPISSRLVYYAQFGYQNPSTAQLEKGVDTFRLYRSDPVPPNQPPDDFILSKSVTLGTWSGSAWAFGSSTVEYEVRTDGDTNSSEERDKRVLMPPSFHKVLPKGITAMRYANDRLIAGATASGGTNYEYISRRGQPFQWRDNRILGDEASPGRASLGAETIYGIFAQPGAGVGSDLIFLVTDASIWQAPGRDTTDLLAAQRVCPYGSSAPRAIKLHQGELWFYDVANLQLRVFRGGSWETPSKGEVDNLWETDSVSARTTGIGIFNDRLYLAYTADGGAAWDSCLVYYLPGRHWEANDTDFPSGVLPFQFVPGFFQNSMIAFTHLGGVFYWDDLTAYASSDLDLGTDEIAEELIFPYFQDSRDLATTAKAIEVLADQGTGYDLAVRFDYLNGGQQPGTLTLSEASSGLLRRTSTLGTATGVTRDVAMSPRISGGGRAAKRMLMIWLHTEDRHGRGTKPTA